MMDERDLEEYHKYNNQFIKYSEDLFANDKSVFNMCLRDLEFPRHLSPTRSLLARELTKLENVGKIGGCIPSSPRLSPPALMARLKGLPPSDNDNLSLDSI